MEVLQSWLSAVLAILKIELTLYGFTFSFWDVFLWTLVAGLVIAFLGGLFGGD